MVAVCLFGSVVGCAAAPGPMYVYFETALDTPSGPPEYVMVGRAVQQLIDDTKLSVVVIGHADSRGNAELNRKLSLRRAGRVRALIEGGGVAATRIRLAARGETKPIASNDTAEGRAQNRRTEIFFYYPSEGDPQLQYEARFGVVINMQAEKAPPGRASQC